LKILHVITTIDLAGAENHVLSHVRAQVRLGHEVRIAFLKGLGHLEAEFRAAGAARVVRVGQGPGILFKLAPLVRWAEIVHSHLLKADMAAAVVSTLCGCRRRLVSSKHSDEPQLRSPGIAFLHGILGNLPRKTIVLSDHVAEYMATTGRLKREKITRIYYGIDFTPFEETRAAGCRHEVRDELGVGEDEVLFTCVARFAPAKAHPVLLRAFRKAVRGAPDGMKLRLLLVGDDPYGDGRENMEALAGELGIADRVIFVGLRRDVPRVLAACDCMVQSSLWEGLGLTFLEAMASGLPILTTRVSAIPEVVVDGETGILVTVRDEDELAAGFLRIAGDEEERRRLGAAGRERVHELFAIDRMVGETLAVYEEVLS